MVSNLEKLLDTSLLVMILWALWICYDLISRAPLASHLFCMGKGWGRYIPVIYSYGDLKKMFRLAAGQFTYNHTERRVVNSETVEVMRQLKRREFDVSDSFGCEERGRDQEGERERERDQEGENVSSIKVIFHISGTL